jgi:gliding motility-associated-like protein
MKYFIIIIFIFGIVAKQFSQTVSPAVINSAGGGGTVGSTGVEVYYNIGEPIVSTINNANSTITQGFLQPDIIGNFSLSITPLVQNESCLNKQDGFISLVLNSSPNTTSQILYIWSPATICPTQNCASVDSLIPGTYSVTVLALNSSSVAIDSLTFNYNITASTDPCQITVYNGFTPDGNGLNDFWIIENIENFSKNTVTIFNRWGNRIWNTTNYNNTDNVWNGKTQAGTDLPSGTYFYVIELENGNGIKKGWVELTGK